MLTDVYEWIKTASPTYLLLKCNHIPRFPLPINHLSKMNSEHVLPGLDAKVLRDVILNICAAQYHMK